MSGMTCIEIERWRPLVIELQYRFPSILVAIETKCLRWSDIWFPGMEDVRENVLRDCLKLLVDLFCVPCFALHSLIFDLIVLCNEGRQAGIARRIWIAW
jgi:hypothetical protein